MAPRKAPQYVTADDAKKIARAAAREAAKETIRQQRPHPVADQDQIKIAVREAVAEMLQRYGMDPERMPAMMDDLRAWGTWRELMQRASIRAFLTAVSVAVVGLLGALLVGLGVKYEVMKLFGYHS